MKRGILLTTVFFLTASAFVVGLNEVEIVKSMIIGCYVATMTTGFVHMMFLSMDEEKREKERRRRNTRINYVMR